MQTRIVGLLLFDDTEQKRRHLSRVNDQSFLVDWGRQQLRGQYGWKFLRGRLTNTTTSAPCSLTQYKTTTHQRSRTIKHKPWTGLKVD